MSSFCFTLLTNFSFVVKISSSSSNLGHTMKKVEINLVEAVLQPCGRVARRWGHVSKFNTDLRTLMFGIDVKTIHKGSTILYFISLVQLSLTTAVNNSSFYSLIFQCFNLLVFLLRRLAQFDTLVYYDFGFLNSTQAFKTVT